MVERVRCLCHFDCTKWRSLQERQLFSAEDGWSIELPKSSVPTAADLGNGGITTQLIVWRRCTPTPFVYLALTFLRNDLCLTFDLPLATEHTKQASCVYAKK